MIQREVNAYDVYLLDQHVMDHTDDNRFVGYRSDPNALLERSLKASEGIRGQSLDVVEDMIYKQNSILHEKTTAMLNVLAQNQDDKYHIDNAVVSSYLSKLVDDYAVSDYIRSNHSNLSYGGFEHYYEPGDENVTYTVIDSNPGNPPGNPYIEMFESSSEEDIRAVIKKVDEHHGTEWSNRNLKILPKDEISYAQGDEFMSGESVIALFRGERIGEVWGDWTPREEGGYEWNPEDPDYDGKGFVSKTTSDKYTPGVYKVEDGEVYRYNLEETEVVKVSGKDSVLEAKQQNERNSYLQNARMRRFDEMTQRIERYTERHNDFDFAGVMPKLHLHHFNDLIPEPKPKPVSAVVEKELEDELEL